MSEGVLNRFLKYVRYNTQSVRESDTEPSSAKELVLAEELVRELKDLGITDARIGKGGVVYATIPATKGCEECPAVGFIAHMDTSPDASGTDVKPQILRFTGDDVLLNAEKNIVFPVKNFPEIAKYKGEDIVFTHGMKAIKDTLIIACIGTPLGGLLGVLIGYAATRLKVRGHKTLETVSLLNYTLPGTVVGIAYIIAFNDKPLVLTGTVWILVAAYLFRYSSAGIRNVIAALTQIDPSIEEASRSLGASSFKTFTSITIPMVLPAVLAGMRYLFIHSMTAISATIFLVSVHWTLITTRILECMTELQFAQACAFSVVLILLVFTASGLMALIARTLCRTGDNIGAR